MKKTKFLSPFLLSLGLVSLPSGLISLASCGTTVKLRYVPESVMKISGSVLSGFNTSVDLSQYDVLKVPEGVRVIAKDAFKGMFTAGQGEDTTNNKIKTIILPSGIKYIEDGAFQDCNGVDTLDLTAWTDYDLKNTKIENRTYTTTNSQETTKGTAFSGWKTKGTIKYKSEIKSESKEEFITKTELKEAWAKPEEKDPYEGYSEAHIMSFNDLHGAAPGYGDDYFNKNSAKNAGLIRIAQDMAPTLNKYPGSFIVSAGDTNAGESFSTCKQADTLYPVLSAMGVRYSAVGNHGWDYGLDKLTGKHFDNLARTSKTNGNWFLASNILQKDDSQWPKSEDYEWGYNDTDYHLWNDLRVKWADPYKVVDMNGHKVCLIGLTTHDTTTDGNKAALTTTRFFKKEQYPIAVGYSKRLAKEQLGDEEYSKIDAFILLTHCDSAPVGDNPEVIEDTGEAAYIAKKTHSSTNSKIDAIISAHSHKIVAGVVANEEPIQEGQETIYKQIWIGQAEQSGRKWLDVTLKFDDHKQPGNRLYSIEMNVKQPTVPASFLDASNQLQEIIKTTPYPSVKKVINEYNKQKVIAKQELALPVGYCDYHGLEYWYYENGRALGTQWLQSPTIVEPLGAWATGAQTYMFNEWNKQDIIDKKILPCSVSINNLDSYKTSIPKKSEGETSNMTKDFIYSLHPYENQIRYGCLTPYQLKQYINYILDGGSKFNYDEKWVYLDSEDINNAHPVKFYYEKYNDLAQQEAASNIIKWDETNEKIKDPRMSPQDPVTAGVSTSCGSVQFHGMKFTVKKTGRTYQPIGEELVNIYELDDTKEIYIYCPSDSSCKFEDPSTWKKLSDIENSECPYVPISMSSFCWQGGNAQNRMLNHWFVYNYNKIKDSKPELAKKIQCRQMNPFYTTRLTAQEYAKIINDQSKALNYYLFPQGGTEFVKQQIIIPAE